MATAHRKGKKNKKELLLLILTFLMLAALVIGVVYTQSESYLANLGHQTTHKQQPKKVSNNSEVPVTTEATTPSSTEEQDSVPTTDIV